ncbi:MAG: ABC transporter ATP-binding protein [Hyphomicrobiales bacterium]
MNAFARTGRHSSLDGTAAGGLALRSVSKAFGNFQAVDQVDLTVKPGEFLTLLGPSGSGKTTLLMMIAGFVDPTGGEIRLGDKPITALPPEKRDFGMVFQGYALFPHMTVAGNIAYPLEVRKQPREAIAARVAEMLDLVQLTAFADRYPAQLSGGQQQRVALARALAFGPRLLLLDEPLGALDRKLRVDVQAQLKDLHLKTGTTFIYVTHDQEEALSMSDRIAIMNRGRIVQLGSPEELYEHPTTAFAADFLGKSNFIDGTYLGREGGTFVIGVGDLKLRQHTDGRERQTGEAVTLALRPERIALVRGQARHGDVNRIEGTIARLTFYGPEVELVVDAGAAGLLTVKSDAWRNRRYLEIGQTVELGWPEEAAVIVTRP